MSRWPSMGAMTERADLKSLQAENARLVALLESHGIAWRTLPAAAPQPTLTTLTPEPPPAPSPQYPRAVPRMHLAEYPPT